MDYKQYLQIAKQVKPDATDAELRQFYDQLMEQFPDMTVEEFINLIPAIQEQVEASDQKEGKLAALNGMRGQ